MNVSRKATTVFLALAATSGMAAVGVDWPSWEPAAEGHLSGTDTVDKTTFSAKQGDTVEWRVAGAGSGSNELTVKIQQQKAGGGWETLVTRTLDMPKDEASGSFVVKDYREGDVESLRFRLSRKILTPAISWYVQYPEVDEDD
jgi:hypothetical protein